MDWGQVLSNQWTVAMVATLGGIVLVPLLRLALDFLRARIGHFSGRYLSLSWNPDRTFVHVEEVLCAHRGNRMAGTIRGVATLKKDPNTNQYVRSEANLRKYKFSGNVEDRLLVLSYRSSLKAVRSAGCISIEPENTGLLFFGEWVGLVDKAVLSGECLWRMLGREERLRSGTEAFLQLAESLANQYAAALDRQDRRGRRSKTSIPPINDQSREPKEVVDLPGGKSVTVPQKDLIMLGREYIRVMQLQALLG